MNNRLHQRSNDEWFAALRGTDPQSASTLEELQVYLQRTLRKILRGRETLSEHDYSDLTQEASLKIVESMSSFRGESSFLTWATTVATRVAFTELRKRSARERGQQVFELAQQDAGAAPSAEELATKGDLLQALHHAIETELSERQKVAILAELRGLPTIEVARQLKTNQNALYKLVHDGRKKLRSALIAAGFTAESIHESVKGGSER